MSKSKGRILTSILKLLLYIILISGILFFLLIFDKIPPLLIECKLIFIIAHKILGYIFGILIMYHCIINKKWYKAWFTGKIKNARKSMLTKWISIIFIFITFSLFLDGLFPRKIYACIHAIIGITWIILMIYHIKAKRSTSKKTSQKPIRIISS